MILIAEVFMNDNFNAESTMILLSASFFNFAKLQNQTNPRWESKTDSNPSCTTLMVLVMMMNKNN
jgi:hypothetical protein